MSHSARLADYRAALSTPGARVPVATSIMARLPIAMIGLSQLLYVQRRTGSFAIAGVVSAAVLIGVGCGAVMQGRIMDRLGTTRPLLVFTGLFTVAVTAGVLAIEAHAPTGALVALGLVVGMTEPSVASASRALWNDLLPPGSARQAAYAYEAISMEVFFILGPALAGVLLVVPWPGTGVVVGSSCMALGAAGFALSRAVREQRPGDNARDSVGLLGALASPGMRTVALAAMGFGVTIGFIEVAVPAAATLAGQAPMGGVLLALWSVSSVVFGVLYAMRPWPRPLHVRLPVLLAAFAVLVAPLALASSIASLALLLLLAGLMITPQSTAHSAVIEQVAPAGTAIEAFGWVITAVTAGLAIGQSISGYLVEHEGVPAAFLASSAAGALFAVLIWIFRGTVAAGVPVFPPRDLAEAR